MKPGRKLDRLVATAVLGLKIGEPCDGEMIDYVNGSCWTCRACGHYEDHGPAPHKIDAKNYSTFEADAIALIAHLESKDFHVSVQWPGGVGNRFDKGTVGCTIMDRTRIDRRTGFMPIVAMVPNGEAMAHAVCLATLNAFKIEIPVDDGMERVALSRGNGFRLVDIPEGESEVTIQTGSGQVTYVRDPKGSLTPKGEYSVFVEHQERT